MNQQVAALIPVHPRDELIQSCEMTRLDSHFRSFPLWTVPGTWYCFFLVPPRSRFQASRADIKRKPRAESRDSPLTSGSVTCLTKRVVYYIHKLGIIYLIRDKITTKVSVLDFYVIPAWRRVEGGTILPWKRKLGNESEPSRVEPLRTTTNGQLFVKKKKECYGSYQEVSFLKK